jgi:putative protease
VDRNGVVLQDKRYLLSLRDLNLSNDLGALLKAGVQSFKIEGRLKDKSYVMNVVGYYRQQLDTLLEGKEMRPASSGKVIFDFQPNPVKTFNRGFTQYFLHGRKEPVGATETPKALGEPVGKVTRIVRNAFQLSGGVEIHRADGLCFFNSQRELLGTTVNEVQGALVYPDRMDGLTVGAEVYRNHDHVFLGRLEKSQTTRKISVRFRLAETAWSDEQTLGLALFAQDEDGNEAMVVQKVEKVLAEKPDQAFANIEKQLRKSGGTEFDCAFVRIDLSQAYFLPLSILNALRRDVLESLMAQRLENYPRPTGGALRNDVPYPEKTLTYRGNVLNAKAAAFYRRHGVETIQPAAESGLDMRGRLVMTTRHCIKYQLGYCPKINRTVHLEEPLSLIDEQGNHFPLRFRCERCEMEVYDQEINE